MGEILLVEDDALDAVILRRAVRELGWTERLVHLTDGPQALAYLTDREDAMPCVILLDLNMPKMTGFEFLETVKARATLRDIPIVVVTTSEERQDRARSFELGAAGYIVKSADYAEFRRSIRGLHSYLAPTPAGNA